MTNFELIIIGLTMLCVILALFDDLVCEVRNLINFINNRRR